jgi:ATP-dependent DNA helicase DinG
VDARSESCTGQKCAQFERCFITLMHQRAAASDIVIVNHHLFFADLAVRQDDFAAILPDFHAVIFDEAHELEDVASQYFGLQVSNYRLEDLTRDAEQLIRTKDIEAGKVAGVLRKLRKANEEFFDCFPGEEGRYPFNNREAFLERHTEVYEAITGRLKSFETALAAMPDKPEEIFNLIRRAGDLRRAIEFLLESDDRSFVFWFERRGRGVFVQATPINVSQLLNEQLFERYDTIVLTSATLAVTGSFEYVKHRLGLEHSEEAVVTSHFDHNEQAVLYLPGEMPDVRHPDFAPSAAEEIVQLLDISQGHAFVLFTSYYQMKEVHRRVSARIDYPVLLQGTAPRSVLLDEFRETPNAVLFATASFWQGVDVQGKQLSCVIIDKLPFAVPSAPVVQARCQALQEAGHNPFMEYQVPEAIISLKQGLGRLLRSRTDHGVLSILDNRVRKKQYGRLFLESLPPYRITSKLEDVRRFFHHEG